jgi:hypothetical protein
MGLYGLHAMAMIKIDDEARDELRKYKAEYGDTYTEAVWRLLNNSDHRLADAEPSTIPDDAPRDENNDPNEL